MTWWQLVSMWGWKNRLGKAILFCKGIFSSLPNLLLYRKANWPLKGGAKENGSFAIPWFRRQEHKHCSDKELMLQKVQEREERWEWQGRHNNFIALPWQRTCFPLQYLYSCSGAPPKNASSGLRGTKQEHFHALLLFHKIYTSCPACAEV